MFQYSSTTTYTFTEYELKQKLYDIMQNSPSFLAHEKHLVLNNILTNSMGVDESDAIGDTPSQHKISHDGQDPPEDREGEKRRKRRQKDVGGSSSKKSKAQEDSQHYERGDDAEEPKQNEETENIDETKEVLDVEEEPNEHEYQNGSVAIFGKLVKKTFNKDKICKEDMEDKIDWTNPEGDRFHHDLSKPLPLTGPPGKKRILVSYFYNHDLEYLKYGTKQRTYALLVTKIKAVRYEDEGIEEMIPYLWSPIYSELNIRSVQSIKVKKKYGYAYLEEIVVTRTDEKEYKKRLIRADEIHKFCYGTLNKVLRKLEVILRNNRHNEGMEKYKWTEEDRKRIQKFVDKIEKTFKEQRRFRRLELFVGGRRDKTNYCLLVRHE
ncbi:hypothetical protein Tco_1337924 [Tanacetum coccineum]